MDYRLKKHPRTLKSLSSHRGPVLAYHDLIGKVSLDQWGARKSIFNEMETLKMLLMDIKGRRPDIKLGMPLCLSNMPPCYE